MIKINIAKDFTDTPGGRYKSEGPYSGEEFRETLLEPKYLKAISNNEKLEINMDGCFGFPSSFIDESFGGLARKLNDKEILKNIIIITNDEPGLIYDIEKAIKNGK